MKNRLKRMFTENIPWKILSLILGIAIWVALSNTQDPIVTRTLNVPIRYLNEDLLLTSESLIPLSKPESIGITVNVRQSKQNRLSADLFTCTADLTDHNGGVLSNQRVHVTVTQVSGSDIVVDWNYTKNDPNVSVVMDNYITKEFPVQLLLVDILDEGMVLEDSVSFDPAVVHVSGPESEFSSLASVKAVVNQQELSEGGGGILKKAVELSLFDANDNVISNSDGRLKLTPGTALMNATVSSLVQASVKLDGTVGTPSDGYKYFTYSIQPEVVSLYGLKSAISTLSEIRIPAEAVDISGITGETTYDVDLTPYIPEGVTLASSSVVQVKIFVEELSSKNVSVPTAGMVLSGKREGYVYQVTPEVVNVRVKGFREDLDILDAATIPLFADVSALEDGNNRVQVSVGELNGYTYMNGDSVFVTIAVTPPESETESSEESSSESQSESETSQTEKTSETEHTSSSSSQESVTEPSSEEEGTGGN